MSLSFSNKLITIVSGGFVLIVAQKLQTSPLRVLFWPKKRKNSQPHRNGNFKTKKKP